MFSNINKILPVDPVQSQISSLECSKINFDIRLPDLKLVQICNCSNATYVYSKFMSLKPEIHLQI
jgi:hypothetical protein